VGNHNSGRRPQPTALKVLRGNPSKTKLNEDEPKPPQGEVTKPQMGPEAGVVWDRVAPIALAMGTLTPADVEAFKVFCQVQAALDVATDADLVKLAATVRAYYAMFGLEPSARAKLRVQPKDKAESKWGELVG
jgi:phage terminase small subunit